MLSVLEWMAIFAGQKLSEENQAAGKWEMGNGKQNK